MKIGGSVVRFNPTTKAQLSGHKFLKRRIEHGLALGDIRMIHDPLARRRRALFFGLATSALLVVGSLALAFFAPQAHPGDARIIEAQSGQLFVQIDQAYHPVNNLASARLVVGEAEKPQRISDSLLADFPKAVPIGIIDAPGIFDSRRHPYALDWFACHYTDTPETRTQVAADRLTLIAHKRSENIKQYALSDIGDSGHQAAFLARVADEDYLVTAAGRQLLPPEESPFGRSVRRSLGISHQTPRWIPPAELFSAITELVPMAVPDPRAQVWKTSTSFEEETRSTELSAEGKSVLQEQFWLYLDDKVTEISALQAEILVELGYVLQTVQSAEIAHKEDLNYEVLLPSQLVEMENPSKKNVCVTQQAQVVLLEENTQPLMLSGSSVATHYQSVGTSIAVDTGQGTHIISETGLRHQVADQGTLEALGIGEVHDIPWLFLRLLPEGTPLTKEKALMPIY
ncbi:type VII secretion protein EccB [Corynebacterium sp. sy017]|nr:type VII secretion protein EccB [Corynebacterium sp. sy017]TSD91938.1 type VII secretion protein EccB [Corynebacterium sp. SY003]